jgi:hypothetical protein
MKKKYVIFTTVMILVGLVIWELIPPQEITEIYEIKQELNIENIEKDCIDLEELHFRKWMLTYPGSVPKNESIKLSAVLLSDPETKPIGRNENLNCKFAVEMRWIYTENLKKIEESIISPYQSDYPMVFEWETTMGEDDLTGNVWVYLASAGSEGELSRTALLIIPINVINSKILKFPPRSFRLILAGILILFNIFTVYFIDRRVNDII